MLKQLGPVAMQVHGAEELRSVDSGLIYFLSRGRNAWNGNWSRQYKQNGSAYTTLKDAQQAAESRRGPGNVFYIRETPGLIFCSGDFRYLALDIHPDVPFETWRGDRWYDNVPGVQFGLLHLNVLRQGVSLGEIRAALNVESWHWSHPRRSEHSLVLCELGQADSLEDIPSQKLMNRTSRSFGPRYFLGWNEEPTGHNPEGVNKVVESFGRALASGAK